jgi:LMBR1 domain-containing protein 1
LWLIHIALFVIPITLQMKGLSINPIAPFLNEMLSLTKDVPIVGIALYALFIFYLLGCVMKGNAKLGMRVVFFTIHPLVIGETLMSALVFNAGIVLLCSLPLAYFGTIAFSDYAKFTSNQCNM